MQLFHALFGPNVCKKHLVWRQNTLTCRVCGTAAGFRYMVGEDLHIFLFSQFKDQYEIIMERPETRKIVSASDVLGQISFVDFDTAIMEMKDSIANITYHGFDGLGAYAPSEEEEFDYGQDENCEQCAEDRCGDCDPVVGVLRMGA